MSVLNDPQRTIRGAGRFGASLPLYARFTNASLAPNHEGTPHVQAEVSTITYTVYALSGYKLDTREAVAAYTGASVTVSDAVFNSLQPWEWDALGYNFKHVVPPTAFATGNAWYDVDYKITYADGTVGVIAFQIFMAA